jgi:flagellar motility protein MotE (MotC chaperone)
VIVTRQRRRRSNLGRFALPLLALAALAVALMWPPSHDAIANGPLKPVWTVAGRVLGTVSTPLHFAAQQQQITERNQQVRDLNARLEQQRSTAAADDAKVQQLQQQISALANQPHPTPLPSVRPTQAAGAAGLGVALGGQSAPVSDGDRHLAATWAAMEPEKAAAIIQRLPDDEVVRILALMDADAAAQIMNALPANVAARLSRVSPQVGTTTNR